MQGVAGDDNALGYFGFAYYAENQDKLKAVPIVDQSRHAGGRAAERRTVKDGTYQPLSRPIFIYVNVKSLDQAGGESDFVDFYLRQGGEAGPRKSTTCRCRTAAYDRRQGDTWPSRRSARSSAASPRWA